MASASASAAFFPAIFHQDQALLRQPPKDFQGSLPNHGKRPNLFSSSSVGIQTGAPHFEHPWKFSSLISDNQLCSITPVINEPMFIDVQDACHDSVLFSFGVAEQCTRHEKILKFLTSSSNIMDGNDLNMSLISNLMGFQTVTVDMCPQPQVPMDDENCLYGFGVNESQKIILPQGQLYIPQPLLDFVGNLSHTSFITVHPNGDVLFKGSEAEMKNLLSIVAEFSLPKSMSNGSRKESVVPYFTRRRGGHVRASIQAASVLETQTAEPLKSTEKNKSQEMKKQNKNLNSERVKKNYLYACDCLIDFYLDRSGNKMTLLSLKDSGPELTRLLSQISVGMVGMGLAVLISVACQAMNGKMVLLTSAKLLNLSFGLGLFWLARAVSELRDTVYRFSKRSARGKKANDEVVVVEKFRASMNEILLRFVALMVVGVLGF